MSKFSRMAVTISAFLALTLCLGGCTQRASSDASNDRGSVHVDGSQITMTLTDSVSDGYTWQPTTASGLQLSTSDVDVTEAGKATFIYGVEPNTDVTIDVNYTNDADVSDVMYVEKLTVKTDDKGNVTLAQLDDSEGTSATVSR